MKTDSKIKRDVVPRELFWGSLAAHCLWWNLLYIKWLDTFRKIFVIVDRFAFRLSFGSHTSLVIWIGLKVSPCFLFRNGFLVHFKYYCFSFTSSIALSFSGFVALLKEIWLKKREFASSDFLLFFPPFDFSLDFNTPFDVSILWYAYHFH